jgi:hypothetical protein
MTDARQAELQRQLEGLTDDTWPVYVIAAKPYVRKVIGDQFYTVIQDAREALAEMHAMGDGFDHLRLWRAVLTVEVIDVTDTVEDGE